jgi:hypothetical protein
VTTPVFDIFRILDNLISDLIAKTFPGFSGVSNKVSRAPITLLVFDVIRIIYNPFSKRG